jgi:hypothetical protein
MRVSSGSPDFRLFRRTSLIPNRGVACSDRLSGTHLPKIPVVAQKFAILLHLLGKASPLTGSERPALNRQHSARQAAAALAIVPRVSRVSAASHAWQKKKPLDQKFLSRGHCRTCSRGFPPRKTSVSFSWPLFSLLASISSWTILPSTSLHRAFSLQMAA